MLEAHKPQITDMLKTYYTPQATDKAPALSGINIVDGGSLLYTIHGTKRSTFKDILLISMLSLSKSIIFCQYAKLRLYLTPILKYQQQNIQLILEE